MDTTGTNKALSGEQQSAPHAGNHAEVTEQLRRLGRELAALEGILARAASDREESLNQWSRQVNLLEQLLHFQHNCLDFSSPGAAADGLFSYLKPLVPYQEAYLILVPGEVSAERRIFATHAKQIPAITVLLDNNGAEKKILEILGDAGACRRFGEGEAPLPAEIQWHFLETRNLLLFPIRIRRKLIGFGLLSSNSLSF
nr:hypothetical protein [Calditrichia bacterium]